MTPQTQRPRRWSAAADRAREELLRPCPYLGYDHDRIGVHCLAKEAFGVAERIFRRAIWLNPYEPRFVYHLAIALFRQKRRAEALEALEGLDAKWADFGKAEELRRTILAIVARAR
jgi:hypothetical protein